jgi:hypothetical protein
MLTYADVCRRMRRWHSRPSPSRLRCVDGWARMSKTKYLRFARARNCYQVLSPCKCTPHKSLRQSHPAIHTHTHTHVYTHTHTQTHKHRPCHTPASLSFFVCFFLSLFIYKQRSKVVLDRKLSRDAAADQSAVSCGTQLIHVVALVH